MLDLCFIGQIKMPVIIPKCRIVRINIIDLCILIKSINYVQCKLFYFDDIAVTRHNSKNSDFTLVKVEILNYFHGFWEPLFRCCNN